jgi:uncharacterized protein YacL
MHYVDGLIGMIVFFLIFGLFINKVTRLLKEAEIWIMQRSTNPSVANKISTALRCIIQISASLSNRVTLLINNPNIWNHVNSRNFK